MSKKLTEPAQRSIETPQDRGSEPDDTSKTARRELEETIEQIQKLFGR